MSEPKPVSVFEIYIPSGSDRWVMRRHALDIGAEFQFINKQTLAGEPMARVIGPRNIVIGLIAYWGLTDKQFITEIDA